MRKFKRLTITLALLIMAVTGAWAQSSLNVVELEVPAVWENDNNPVTAADLPGFKTSTLAEAQTWTGAPKPGMAVLVYAFDGNKINLVFFSNGKANEGGATAEWTKKQVFGLKSNMKFYYTAEITEWSLTPDADKKVWTLDKMPANDVELQVEYYDPILTLAANNSEWGSASVVYPDLKTKVTKYNLLGGTAGYNDNEALSKLFDGNTGTKWCCEGKNSFVEFSTDNAIRVVSYVLTTANDNESNTGRNPKSWLLKGKLDENDEWKIIATVNNDTKMKNVNYTPYEFDVDKPGTYKYFRFEIKETTGSNVLQLSEMNLLKSEINGVIDNGDGTYNVKSGTQLDIKAIPAEGYHVASWSNDYEVSDPNGAIQTISVNEDKTITAIFAENPYAVTFAEGTPEADKWKAEPNTDVKKGETVTVTYTGTKKVLGVKAEKKKAGPLAAAFENGTKFKVGYNWNHNTTYLEFTNSGGTYSITSGSGDSPEGFNSSTLTVNGNVLVLDFVCEPHPGDILDIFCAQIEFDATSSTYKYLSKGEYFESIFSVSVNGTDVTDQLSELK